MRNLLLLLLLASALSAHAQTIQERMRVILREARVHVLDSDGNPVRGLTKDDFILRENGVRQKLTWFQEVDYESMIMKPGQIIQEVNRPRRNSVIVLDTADMAKADFDDLLESARNFIREELGPDDFVKLVQLDEKATSLTRFTSDKQTLIEGLDKAEFKGRLKREIISMENEIVEQLPEFQRVQNEVRRWQNIADSSSGQQRQNALNEVARYESMRDAIAMQIDRSVRDKEITKSTHYRGHYLQMQSIVRMLAPMQGTRSIFLLSGGLYLEEDSEYRNTKVMAERLGRLLNTYKITVYAIQQATRNPPAEGQLQMTNVPININSLQNMSSLLQEYSKNYAGKLRNPANTVLENNRQSQLGIRAAAEATGGVYKRGLRANMGDMLREARRASAQFYTLGYQVDENNADRPAGLKIELTANQAGYTLHYGDEFARDIPYRKLEPDEQEVNFKADLLYANIRRDDLSAEWDYYLFGNRSTGYKIPVTGLVPHNERHKEFDIGFAALDEFREPLDFSYTSLKSVPEGKRLEFYDVLLTETRPRYIRFAVRNLANDEYSIHEIMLPPPRAPEDGPHLSDLLLSYNAGKTLPLNMLRKRSYESKEKKRYKKAGAESGHAQRVREDPLRVGNRDYRPNGIARFSAPKFVDVFFQLQNFTDNDPKLFLSFLVRTEEGIFGPVMEMVSQSRVDAETLFYHCRLDMSNVKPGFYDIWLRVVDQKTKLELKSTHSLEITDPAS
ncbi:MAG: VWA domain-containing protein [Acidobacteriota bacterium]|nr:VWA domain-containing protein [Acidobacteriota bacterium]